ncbi:MAG TPA: hypothetical protein VMH85_20620 [Terriglobales bacterium]|nr:hypothetical protein [Terriglobales bacterium]
MAEASTEVQDAGITHSPAHGRVAEMALGAQRICCSAASTSTAPLLAKPA